jgi:hypothetical protein
MVAFFAERLSQSSTHAAFTAAGDEASLSGDCHGCMLEKGSGNDSKLLDLSCTEYVLYMLSSLRPEG